MYKDDHALDYPKPFTEWIFFTFFLLNHAELYFILNHPSQHGYMKAGPA